MLKLELPEMRLLDKALQKHRKPIITHSLLVDHELFYLVSWVLLSSNYQVPNILTLGFVQVLFLHPHGVITDHIDEHWLSFSMFFVALVEVQHAWVILSTHAVLDVANFGGVSVFLILSLV